MLNHNDKGLTITKKEISKIIYSNLEYYYKKTFSQEQYLDEGSLFSIQEKEIFKLFNKSFLKYETEEKETLESLKTKEYIKETTILESYENLFSKIFPNHINNIKKNINKSHLDKKVHIILEKGKGKIFLDNISGNDKKPNKEEKDFNFNLGLENLLKRPQNSF